MKHGFGRSQRWLFLMCFLLLILLAGTLVVVGQTNNATNLVIYPSQDWFIIYVPAPQVTWLQGLQFGVTNSPGIVNFQNIQTAFPQLSNAPAQAGACYVYQIIGQSTIYPNTCSPTSTFIDPIPLASAFWINPANNLPSNGIGIYQGNNLIVSCPTSPECVAPWSPLPTLTATYLPAIPVNLQGLDNTGQIQLADLESVVEQTNIRSWMNAGLTGRGIKIGVLHGHFGRLNAFDPQGLVTLPPGANRVSYDSDNITLGVNALQVIHAVVPDALLYACRYDDFSQFKACIDWMIGEKVNIVNHSASIPVLVLNGQNDWAKEVDRTAEAGILWVDAAGNFEKSRLIQDFTDGNQDGLHEFRRISGYNQVLGFLPIRDVSGTVMLTWGDDVRFPANQVDLELRIIDPSSGNPIATSDNPQYGNSDDQPLESVTFDMSQPFGVQIVDHSGGTDTQFALFVEFANLPNAPIDESIAAPGDSPKALTVGVLQGPLVAPYSSRGPVMGADKPDLVAPGEIQMPDGTRFVGSAAAASLVTGFAALVWQAQPGFTNRQVFEFIRYHSTTDDTVFKFGPDQVYGQGYLQVPALTPQPTITPIPSETPSLQPGVTPSATLAPTASLTPVSDTLAIVKEASVNLRGGPGGIYDVKDYAYAGDGLPVVAEAFGWYVVQSPRAGEVWVSGDVVDIQPPGAVISPAQNIPLPPPTIAPFDTPTFLPTPSAVPGSGDIPGGAAATSTARPPSEPSRETPVINPTPNETATWETGATATQYSMDLTATATYGWETATYEATTTIFPITQTAAYLLTLTPHKETSNSVSLRGNILLVVQPTTTPSATSTATITLTPSSMPTSSNPPTATWTPSATVTSGPTACVPSRPDGWVSYTVQSGDTVGYLAGVTKTRQEQIVSANCLSDANFIVVSNQLFLPKLPPTRIPPTDIPTSGGPITPGTLPTPCAGCPTDTPLPPQPISISISLPSMTLGRPCDATVTISISGGPPGAQVYVKPWAANHWYELNQPPGDDKYPPRYVSNGDTITVGFGGTNEYLDHWIWLESMTPGVGSSNTVHGQCTPNPTPTS